MLVKLSACNGVYLALEFRVRKVSDTFSVVYFTRYSFYQQEKFNDLYFLVIPMRQTKRITLVLCTICCLIASHHGFKIQKTC